MIDKIIAWLFMFMFGSLIVILSVGCWITFKNEAYAFTAIFSIIIQICIIMILIVYQNEYK